MSKKESNNQTRLIYIQDAAKQLDIPISKFLEYIRDHHIKKEMILGGEKVGEFEEMFTIVTRVGKQKYYRLTEDDLQQFINDKEYKLKVSNKDVYTDWYEASKKNATVGLPVHSPFSEEKIYNVSIKGLCIPENDFISFQKVLAKNGIYFFSFNCDTNEVTINGKKHSLSEREFKVLKALYENKDKFLSKKDIMEIVQTGESGEQQIFNIISKLRDTSGIVIENKKATKNYAGGYRLITKS